MPKDQTTLDKGLERGGYFIMKLSKLKMLQFPGCNTGVQSFSLCKGCVTHGWKTLKKMRTYLLARFKKSKQAPRQLQYIGKINHGIKLSLKCWVNIFRQKIYRHFRQKCVSPLSFQTEVSMKDSHCPLAGPCPQWLREGLKSTTVSPALLPHGEENGVRTLLLTLVSITTTLASQ